MFHQVGRFGTFPGYLLPLSLALDTVPPGSGGQGLKPAAPVCGPCFLPGHSGTFPGCTQWKFCMHRILTSPQVKH